ncbi:hypothetical protein C900_00472 [Fulvivirga imtechensis AK7]|uniref:TraB/GumN family protein n=1 Tax=Fulvivirga imtechensis AK7 TaxID=1237149 RepID=L8JJF8_9BACT|nr:TraB/GumN family protein [Fulvivirga imtechensis]ELR68373.1 hypothetical protein C900_00472 [Fulvivirga imtechensis AK7]
MKHIIAILSIIFISTASIAQNTILWTVTDTVAKKTSYVLGTFHQFGNSFVDSIPEIKESLVKSELAVFESIDDVENTRKMINARQASDGIERGLAKKELLKLKEISKEWEVDLYKLTPLEIRWKLQQEFQKIVCKTAMPTDEWDHFDSYLVHLAKESNIEVLGLETDSLQLSLIEQENKNPDWGREKKNIRIWLNHLTSGQPDLSHCSHAEKYRKFNLDYKFTEVCNDDILIRQRNQDWMKIIPDLLENSNCFIAVGYFHLQKQCGLLEQLKARGFVVEPVELK